jgi:DNA-directed RNA polymerase subunit F
MKEISFYSEENIRACSLRLVKKYVALSANKLSKYCEKLQVIEKKFTSNQYYKVALLRPRTEL